MTRSTGFVSALLAAILFLAGCAGVVVDKTTLRPTTETVPLTLEKPFSFESTDKHPGTVVLAPGVYRPVLDNEGGTFYKGEPACVLHIGKNIVGREYRFSYDGGFWLPRQGAAKPAPAQSWIHLDSLKVVKMPDPLIGGTSSPQPSDGTAVLETNALNAVPATGATPIQAGLAGAVGMSLAKVIVDQAVDKETIRFWFDPIPGTTGFDAQLVRR